MPVIGANAAQGVLEVHGLHPPGKLSTKTLESFQRDTTALAGMIAASNFKCVVDVK